MTLIYINMGIKKYSIFQVFLIPIMFTRFIKEVYYLHKQKFNSN